MGPVLAIQLPEVWSLGGMYQEGCGRGGSGYPFRSNV